MMTDRMVTVENGRAEGSLIQGEVGPADMHAQPSGPGLRFDWMDWLPYLEDQDIPDEQKRELIETLWGIVVAFVDLGWQLNPGPELCGQPLDLKAILTDADTGNGKEAV